MEQDSEERYDEYEADDRVAGMQKDHFGGSKKMIELVETDDSNTTNDHEVIGSWVKMTGDTHEAYWFNDLTGATSKAKPAEREYQAGDHVRMYHRSAMMWYNDGLVEKVEDDEVGLRILVKYDLSLDDPPNVWITKEDQVDVLIPRAADEKFPEFTWNMMLDVAGAESVLEDCEEMQSSSTDDEFGMTQEFKRDDFQSSSDSESASTETDSDETPNKAPDRHQRNKTFGAD